MSTADKHDMHVRVARRFIRRFHVAKNEVWTWQNDKWVFNLLGVKNLVNEQGYVGDIEAPQFGQIIGDFTMDFLDHGDPEPFDCLSDAEFYGDEGVPSRHTAYSALDDMALFCVVHTIKSLVPPPKRRGKNS